jgi:hypothetical protein
MTFRNRPERAGKKTSETEKEIDNESEKMSKVR